jgi:hypothetical protein
MNNPWISMQELLVVRMDEVKREGGSGGVDSNPSKEELVETSTASNLEYYVKNDINSAVCCRPFSIEALTAYHRHHVHDVRTRAIQSYRTPRTGSKRVSNVSLACRGSGLTRRIRHRYGRTFVQSSHLPNLNQTQIWSPHGLEMGLRCKYYSSILRN